VNESTRWPLLHRWPSRPSKRGIKSRVRYGQKSEVDRDTLATALSSGNRTTPASWTAYNSFASCAIRSPQATSAPVGRSCSYPNGGLC
jgi:hypothetical protein